MFFHDTPEYKKGDTTQRLLGKFFQDHGWYVIPSYDYTSGNSKAPRMQGRAASYVLPDLDICRAGDRRWAEAKYKDHASWHRKTKRLEHGIPLRHFRHYQRVADVSGGEVWLFIHEGCTGKVLARRINELETHGRIYDGNNQDYGGSIFFPRREFQMLASIEHPIAREESKPVRDVVHSVLARGVRLHFDRATRRVVCFDQLSTEEQVILLSSGRSFEIALTVIVGLELLPWFGDV